MGETTNATPLRRRALLRELGALLDSRDDAQTATEALEWLFDIELLARRARGHVVISEDPEQELFALAATAMRWLEAIDAKRTLDPTSGEAA